MYDEFKWENQYKFTSCILAHDGYTPKDMYMNVNELISWNCASIVVYSKFREPLLELDKYLWDFQQATLISI